MNKKCPTGRDYNPKHTTCRSCPISCSQRLVRRQKQHLHKYGAKKTTVDGIVFPSKKEAAHYQKLKMMEKAGEIYDLELQPTFELVPKEGSHRAVKYVADFRYKDKQGNVIICDVKGMRTPVYKLKKRLMKHVHNIDILEV